jgi:glycogen debranching enzyme
MRRTTQRVLALILAATLANWHLAAFSGIAEPPHRVRTAPVAQFMLAPSPQHPGGNNAMKREDLEQVVGSLKRLMLEHGVQTDEPTGLRFYTGYEYRTLYDIDLYFEGIILYYLGVRDYTKNCIRLFLEQQQDNGMIPRTVQRKKHGWTNEEDLEHCKPFLAQTVLFVSQYEGDYSWITPDMFHKLRKYLNYWLDDCDRNGNGLSEWNSAPHAGADNQFERVGGWQANFCEGVDLNCYLYRECLACARIGDEIGKRQQAADLRGAAQARKEAVQRLLWDDEDKLFYDRDRRTGKRIKIKYLMSFMSLWAEVATRSQAQESLERYLVNPAEFWTPYPASTYALSEPSFAQKAKPGDYSPCNFRGCVWIPYNYWIMHGLSKYGFSEAARQIAKRSYDLFALHDVPREWYNSQTGEGYGADPFWGFTGVAPFMQLELEHNCDPTALDDDNLREKMDRIRAIAGTLEEKN